MIGGNRWPCTRLLVGQGSGRLVEDHYQPSFLRRIGSVPRENRELSLDERAAEARAHRARLGVFLSKALRGASRGGASSPRRCFLRLW